MERPIAKAVGTPAIELDTPALVVDLDVLERNLETVHGFFAARSAKLRPHVESHRCPAIAHKQLAAGGTVGGISVTTVGEAEVFAQSGFDDIFIVNEIVTRQKIARVCALAREARVTVAVDSPDNVETLSQAAESTGVTVGVAVDVHTRLDRCGVEPGDPAVGLAQAAAKAPGLRFAGLTGYEGPIIADSPEALASESQKAIQPVLDTREMVERSGLDVDMVAAGGTHNYEIAGAMDGITEVIAGSYALMDHKYAASRPQLEQAARVLTTVMSHPEPQRSLADCGQKAMGLDFGLPVVDGAPGVSVIRMSAEHGFLNVEPGAEGMADMGEKLWLVPSDVGTCVNLYDYINAVRDGKLQAVWNVAARGRYR